MKIMQQVRQRQGIAMLLMLAFLLAMLSGCASSPDATNSNTSQESNATESATASEESSTTDKGTEEYVIAFSAALSGNMAQDGICGLNGVEIAIEQQNAKGGINGVPIRLLTEDDKSDPKEAAMVANLLEDNEEVLIVVGPNSSSAALACAPIYEAKQLSNIAFSASSDAVSDAGPYVFRTIPTDDVGGRYIIKWMVENLAPKNVGIIYENTDYGNGVFEVYKQQLEEENIPYVAESFMLKETTDFTTSLTKLKTEGIDVLLLGCSYNEAAMICKQATRIGMDIPVVGVDSLYNNALIELGGEDVEGVTFSAFFSDANTDPLVQEFVQLYQEKYGTIPNTFAAYAYDATLMAIKAIEEAGPDRVKINEMLTNMKDVKGVTGINTFDENGDVNTKEPLIITIQDGKFVVSE